MAKKIFVSYKHGDTDVAPLPSGGLIGTTARNYVDLLETMISVDDHIYKGENDGESLEGFKDETIETKLKAKIFDSSVTFVLISKNMKTASLPEDDQWIPWEISYSLKEMTRGDRTSGTNAMLAIVLPDRTGSYDYFVKRICANGCTSWKTDSLFKILDKNMFNRLQKNTRHCSLHGVVHTNDDHSYIHPVKWEDFKMDINKYLEIALRMNQNITDFDILKTV